MDSHDVALQDTIAGVLDRWTPGMPAINRQTLIDQVSLAVRAAGWTPPVAPPRTLLALRYDGRPSPSSALCSECIEYPTRRWTVGATTPYELWRPVADDERTEVPGCTYCGWPN